MFFIVRVCECPTLSDDRDDKNMFSLFMIAAESVSHQQNHLTIIAPIILYLRFRASRDCMCINRRPSRVCAFAQLCIRYRTCVFTRANIQLHHEAACQNGHDADTPAEFTSGRLLRVSHPQAPRPQRQGCISECFGAPKSALHTRRTNFRARRGLAAERRRRRRRMIRSKTRCGNRTTTANYANNMNSLCADDGDGTLF